MEILNQAMEFTQQYSLFFLAGMFAVILILVIEQVLELDLV